MSERHHETVRQQFRDDWPDCWERAAATLDWDREWETVLDESDAPTYHWFEGGRLNACTNCLDRHVAAGEGDSVALEWIGERGETRTLMYTELLAAVESVAAALRDRGVEEDDVVTAYTPNHPALVTTMLACARLGALHSVVPVEFDGEKLATRLQRADSTVLLTCDGFYSGGETVSTTQPVATALDEVDQAVDVIVVNRLDEGGCGSRRVRTRQRWGVRLPDAP